jgi:3D (Asp-Asp-Asp) domain-containing protein
LKFAVQVVPQSMPAGTEPTVPEPFLATVSAKLCSVKVAVTFLAASIVTLQDPAPVQAPLQPVNVDPVAGVAVSKTAVGESKLCTQVDPQLIPVGDDVTVPDPVPDGVTVRANLLGGWAAKMAITLVTAPTLMTHGAVPVHPAPDQPEKSQPVAGVAVSVTDVPKLKFAVQVAPQVIPAGAEPTVPEPTSATESAKLCRVNVAVTLFAASRVTVQVPNPVHAPPHPANDEPVDGAAASVTDVADAKLWTQAAGQLIPEGTELTVPAPVPAGVTDST